MEYLDLLRQKISSSLYSRDALDVILRLCENGGIENPVLGQVHTLGDLKNKSKKKGDIFEAFCYLYLTSCDGRMKEVWFLAHLPEDIRRRLHLGKRDMGIDLIGRGEEGEFYAIQVKYRKRRSDGRKNCIPWKELSTFHALAHRTGPFAKHIVFTNADYTRQMGKKQKKEETIAWKSLQKISHFSWLAMANLFDSSEHESIKSDPSPSPRKSEDEEKRLLREKRLAYFSNK